MPACSQMEASDACATCKCKICPQCQAGGAAPALAPPGGKEACASRWKSDVETKECQAFCHEGSADIHCTMCKCSGCSWCGGSTARVGGQGGHGGHSGHGGAHRPSDDASALPEFRFDGSTEPSPADALTGGVSAATPPPALVSPSLLLAVFFYALERTRLSVHNRLARAQLRRAAPSSSVAPIAT